MITKIKEFINELGKLGPVFTFAVLAPGLGILLLTATAPNWLEPMKEAGLNSISIFLCSAILLTGLSLIPTHAVSLVAGILYGVGTGSYLAVIAIISASLFSFFICSYLVGDRAVEVLRKKPRADSVYKELLKHNAFRTIYIIILVRLSPVMPFAGTNVLLASAKVKLSEFLIGSTIGLAPRILLVVSAGAGLTKLSSDYDKKELLILGISATIVTIVVLGRISKRVLANMVSQAENTQTQ